MFFPDWPRLPPILVPPVLIPPVEPPCDEDNPDDEDCDEEEKPPVDAPEPALPLLLILGSAVWWVSRRKNQPAA